MIADGGGGGGLDDAVGVGGVGDDSRSAVDRLLELLLLLSDILLPAELCMALEEDMTATAAAPRCCSCSRSESSD